LLYRVLADLVVFTHLAFIGFVLLGGLLALRWRWMVWVHVPTALWGVVVEVFGWVCPLTPLENWLRHASGSAGYPGGFVERYLIPVIYPEALTRDLQLILGCMVVAVNVAVYLVVWRRFRTRKT
jgi:hypothetical protein